MQLHIVKKSAHLKIEKQAFLKVDCDSIMKAKHKLIKALMDFMEK